MSNITLTNRRFTHGQNQANNTKLIAFYAIQQEMYQAYPTASGTHMGCS